MKYLQTITSPTLTFTEKKLVAKKFKLHVSTIYRMLSNQIITPPKILKELMKYRLKEVGDNLFAE